MTLVVTALLVASSSSNPVFASTHPPAAQSAASSEVSEASPPDPTAEEPDSRPPATSDFYPETENISTCVGFAERPGCGSKERGGWRQSLVFAVVLGGLGIIGWRISVGVRKNRAG